MATSVTANSEAMITIAMMRLVTIRLADRTIRWSNAVTRKATGQATPNGSSHPRRPFPTR
jgi:hypothetical protein